MRCPTQTIPGAREATVAYCRKARHLRRRWKGQPSMLHQALRRLNESAPPPARLFTRPAQSPVTPVTVCPAALLAVPVDHERAVRRFVEHVRAVLLVTPLLTHDLRKNLLGVAGRLRIERFHANLVIAAISHEFAGRRAVSPAPAKRSPSGLLPTAVLTQAIIISAAILAWIML